MQRILATLLCFLLVMFLSSCSNPGLGPEMSTAPSAEGAASGDYGSESRSTEGSGQVPSSPKLQYGTLETQRLEATAVGEGAFRPIFQYFAEMEEGCYFRTNNHLYYADKTDLSNWVPVCGKPDCDHQGVNCNAYVGMGSLVTEDRIYYIAPDATETVAAPGVECEFLVSMALDGTDRKVEFYFEDFNERWKAHGSGGSYVLTPDCYFVYHSNLNTEGRYENIVYVADEEGEYIAYSGVGDVHTADNYCANNLDCIYGDFCYYMANVSGSYTTIYRLQDRQLYSTDLGDLPVEGSHLDGNTLRFYRPGDGYYDIDLTTRQETRLDDAQLENACAHIMLPNCIFETTLATDREPGFEGDHQLRFYDGVGWYNVTLPEELVRAGDDTGLKPLTVISDRVIFRCYMDSDGIPETLEETRLYQMRLESEEPVLELMAVFPFD